MNFDLVQTFRDMQPFAWAIVIVLIIMAMSALSIVVERLWVYYKSRKMAKRFAADAGRLLEARQLAEVIKLSKSYDGCHLASMLAAGSKTYLAATAQPGELSAVELAKRELARQAEAVSSDVRRGMGLLASVGSVAPFVGLLGTVIGIIAAFQGIGSEGGLGEVSKGISEALVVTAVGLVVAIPSVLAFNFLSGRADTLLLALDQSRGEFLDYLENQGGGSVGGGAREVVGGDVAVLREAHARA